MGELTLAVASDLDRDEPCVELWFQRDGRVDIWADVAYDRATDGVRLRISPQSSGDDWVFDLSEVRDILKRAHRKAVELADVPASEMASVGSDAE